MPQIEKMLNKCGKKAILPSGPLLLNVLISLSFMMFFALIILKSDFALLIYYDIVRTIFLNFVLKKYFLNY
jgi:hypothetical protein